MYKVQRKQTIEDELVIENSKGEEALRLPVKLYVDDVLGQYNRLRRMLGEAQYNAEQNPTDDKTLTALGMTVMALFSLIFGEEGAQKLEKYYENRWTEMLQDVAPFVSECINPQIDAAMRQRADRFRSMSKTMKKGKKWLK